MMIDDDTLKQLLRIDDELMQLCNWLNEKRDVATSSKLIPLDDLTHILVEAGKNKLHKNFCSAWQIPLIQRCNLLQ